MRSQWGKAGLGPEITASRGRQAGWGRGQGPQAPTHTILRQLKNAGDRQKGLLGGFPLWQTEGKGRRQIL